MRAVVAGAGAFGGWIAIHLQQRGVRVTLVDPWGPGNSRSSSGGETRIIRTMYGAQAHYTKMAARALELWKEYEQRWQTRLLYSSGMLLMAGPADEFLSNSKQVMQEQGIAAEEWNVADAERRFPQIWFDGVGSTLFEPGAGVLTARENCRTIVQRFIAAGGDYSSGALTAEIARSNDADVFVFACGAWLPKLFPEVLRKLVRPTKQDVFFAGPPPGNSFDIGSLPAWADSTSGQKYYGIPDFQHRGFKIAADVRGPDFNPDSTDRIVDPEAVAAVRTYLRRRFPGLDDTPLIETRVCHYENTPDLDFIIDRHPDKANVWIVGGGSGHGYKHGPALGEYVASLILDGKEPDTVYRLERFNRGRGITPSSSF